MEIRDLYADKFGEKEAEKLYLSALYHKNKNEVDPPDNEEDSFIWAMLVAIDKQCVERFSDYHKINISYNDFKQFCVEHSETILSYKGKPTSYLGLLSGCFDFLRGEKALSIKNEKLRKRNKKDLKKGLKKAKKEYKKLLKQTKKV